MRHTVTNPQKQMNISAPEQTLTLKKMAFDAIL